MYELYYYVPWPECQKYQGTTNEEYVEYVDHSIVSSEEGVFIEKEWVDKIENKNVKHSHLD